MKLLNVLRFSSFVAASLLLADLTAAEAPVLSPGKLNLVAGDYSVEFSEEGCWTMNWLHYKGNVLLGTTGANQTVVKLKPREGLAAKNEWLGTKHGGEVIESLTLEVDGVAYPFEEPLRAPAGTSYKFIKVAKYGPVRGHWTVALDASGVTQTAKFDVIGDVSEAAYAYVFMHCWDPSMRDWRAVLKSGAKVGERFPEERTQTLKEDITSLAVYSDAKGVGALVTYPTAYAGVAGRKNFLNYWPKRHNKHYLAVSIPGLVRETYTNTIRGFVAPAADWEKTVEALIASTPASAQ